MGAITTIWGSILCTFLTWLSRRSLPQTDGTLRLAGLEGPVEVIRDRWGVPHIYARSSRDLAFAQGYVHAQDRPWQMDFSRRLVAGRLSEVLGAVTLPVDQWIRILGLRRVAEDEVRLLDDGSRAEVEAYAAGVCARIAQRRLPVEFTLLAYRPEPWTIADSLSWSKMMAWTLSVNWESELLRAHLIARLGPQLAAALEPAYPSQCPYVVPPGVDYSAIGTSAEERARRARPVLGPAADQGLGSNNWVLSGSRTTSGKPILANDMHLLMGLPAIWYENHLACPDYEVTGVAFPGVPGVLAGHNGHLAWGYTNGFPDVQDLYVEHLRRMDDGRVQYEYQGQWLDARVLQEVIRVRRRKPVIQEVVITRHGPIINALAPELAGEGPLALRWTALDPGPMTEVLRGMVRARNCREFREALRTWTVPVQNVVYADTEGNIGYSYPGKVPIRARGDGRVPVPGWTGEYEWAGYIPFEKLPHLYNPPQGYVATANNRVVRADYPYDLGCDCCFGDRAERIVELIEAGGRIDLAYVQRMQFDQLSPTARDAARYLGGLEVADPELARVAEMMGRWDGTLAPGSPEAAVHEVFAPRFIRLALGERLGDLTDRYLGQGPTPFLAEETMFGCRSWEWLRHVLADPHPTWFATVQGETRDDLARRALREAVDLLKAELGPDVSDWAWSKLHRVTCAHTLGRVAPLDRLFNRGPYPVGGDGTTVWSTVPVGPDLHTQTIVGPPFRFIADLGDLRNSLGLLAPGQSGQVGSPHYDDQMAAWFAAGYHPILFAREDVEREAESRLQLLPA